MLYIDSHIHLQDYKSQSINNVITAAAENGVKLFFNVSAKPDDWNMVENLINKYPNIIIPAFGVHPWYIEEAPENWHHKLEDLLKKYPQAMVGECGIDRLRNENTQRQQKIFLQHVALAKKYQRPIIIHAVKAEELFLPMLADLPQKTIFHSYVGSKNFGKKIQQHGFYLGLNSSILRKKNAIELLNDLDLHYVLLETDGPYQAPQKGIESLPQDIPLLAKKIAEVRRIEFSLLQNILEQNQQKFLGEEIC